MQQQLLVAITPISQAQSTPGSSKNQPAASTTIQSPSSQTSTPVPTLKDYIPLPMVVVIISSLLAVISTLLWKWHEAEIKRIEKEKDAAIELQDQKRVGELELLEEKQKRVSSEKDNQINILESKIQDLEKRQQDLQMLYSIEPLKFLQETKPALENIIEEYRNKIQKLGEENDELSSNNMELIAEKEDLHQKLQTRLESFEDDLKKLSVLEKHLSERSLKAYKAKLWLEANYNRLALEGCRISLQRFSQTISSEAQDLETRKLQFQKDIADYLGLVGHALTIGRTNLLDKASKQIMPVLDTQLYSEVFKVIRDDILPTELADKEAIQEINIYFDCLVSIFEGTSK